MQGAATRPVRPRVQPQRREAPPAQAGHLPRRPPRPPPDAAHGAADRPLDPPRRRRRHRANARRRRRPPPFPPAPRPRLRRRPHRAWTPAAAGHWHHQRRPLRVHPPQPPRPRRPLHGPRPQRARRHLLHLAPLGDPLADPHRAAVPGPEGGRRPNQGRAGQGRPRGLPGGDDLPGALPAAILRALRRVDRPDRPRGHELQGGALPRDHCQGMEGARSHLLLHEPPAHLRGDVPGAAPPGGDVRRREEPPRGRQPRPEDPRGGAGLRVHLLDQEGQVRGARRERRHREALPPGLRSRRRVAGAGALAPARPRPGDASFPINMKAPDSNGKKKGKEMEREKKLHVVVYRLIIRVA